MADAEQDKAAWRDIIPPDKLQAWMDTKGLGEGPLTDMGILPGGTQNFLLGFGRAGRRYVLRRPPRHVRANSNETMRREARVLAALAGSDVPHPGLIAACPEEDVIGAAFYLMEPIEGFNPSVVLPEPYLSRPDWRRAMGLDLVEGIAALSKIDPDKVGLTGLGKLDGYFQRQAPRWLSQLEGYAEFPEWPGKSGLPSPDAIVKWLGENIPSTLQPGIIHGDYHLANVMYRFDAPKLAAIVDWELCTLGDPLLDLAWIFTLWPDEADIASGETTVKPWSGFPEEDEMIDHYATLTGRDMRDLKWFQVLAFFKLGAILEGTYARACAGKAPTDTGDRLHASTIKLFTRALARIDS
jgi:aminoglycoside phosphotransferase (APT) family kinase protein